MGIALHGQYGAKVLRTLSVAGKSVAPGTELDSDVVMTWPMRNRIALAHAGKLEFLGPPRGPLTPDEIKVGAPVVAPVEQIDPDLGKHGAVTLEPMTVHGRQIEPGVEIAGGDVLKWPLKNRLALQRTGRVAFFKEPPGLKKSKYVDKKEKAMIASLFAE